MDSTHPAPVVTHPYLYAVHRAFVVFVFAAKVQTFVAQEVVVLTTHPVNHVSKQAVSLNY